MCAATRTTWDATKSTRSDPHPTRLVALIDGKSNETSQRAGPFARTVWSNWGAYS
jgi:hypothetical protein